MAWTTWLIPLMVSIIPLAGWIRRVPVYDRFTEGAAECLPLLKMIFPHLLAMLVAVQVVRQSGLLTWLMQPFSPLAALAGVPSELFSMLPLRSISGTGSLAFANEIMRAYGVDSFAGRFAAIVQGSSETTLYVITVYLGAVGVRSSARALGIGLMADIAGFVSALFVLMMLHN